MLGKEECKILKQIRQRIAEENDIPYIVRDCQYQGECSGTCPRCEDELRYLERHLALQASLKKKVAVTAVCAGLVLSTAGCSPIDSLKKSAGPVEPESTIEELLGEVPYPEEEISAAESSEENSSVQSIEEIELTGDVAY